MKKGNLNLSINAIVILILAITALGLGLGFMRNMFSMSTLGECVYLQTSTCPSNYYHLGCMSTNEMRKVYTKETVTDIMGISECCFYETCGYGWKVSEFCELRETIYVEKISHNISQRACLDLSGNWSKQ